MKLGNVIAPTLSYFFKVALVILGPSNLYMNFKINLSIFIQTHPAGILFRVALTIKSI